LIAPRRCAYIQAVRRCANENVLELECPAIGATPTAARQVVRLPEGNQAEVLEAIRCEARSTAELDGVVDLWLRCSERRQQQYLLQHPREALTQAKGALPAVRDPRLKAAARRAAEEMVRGALPAVRDPRLSEAGNQVWKRAGLLLGVLGRMEV
jgi:hypothetical protein